MGHGYTEKLLGLKYIYICHNYGVGGKKRYTKAKAGRDTGLSTGKGGKVI